MPGLNVMLAHDFYPEGHQGGVGIIQNGQRVATNGDLRLDRTPGQWQPVPKVGKRVVDRATGEISVRMEYPDEDEEPQGLQPGRLSGPDASPTRCACGRRGRPSASSSTSKQPLPDEWIGKVGFNLELFPGILFGKTLGDRDRRPASSRARPNGPGDARREGRVPDRAARPREAARHRPRVRPPAHDDRGRDRRRARAGRRPRPAQQRLVRRALAGRRKGATTGAVEWLVTPHAIPGFIAEPDRPGLAGRLPPEAAEVGDRRDWTHATRGGLPVVVSRITGTGALETALEASRAGVGPLPPLRLPAPRLHVGREARACTW